MQYINLPLLQQQALTIKNNFNSKKPFRYVAINNFLFDHAADEVLEAYPPVTRGVWDGTTYVQQKNKFVQTKFEEGSVMYNVFNELNSAAFLEWLEQVTGITQLVPDEKLFGAGLHQSVNGAFLNVHVDFNKHPQTGLFRRLNVLIYLNKNWKPEYHGELELWDMTGKEAVLLETIQPEFNRCVIFETNERSFHGHPKPLVLPKGMSRKSLATYYYSPDSGNFQATEMHNTIFKNTEGLRGQIRKLSSGIKALWERITA